MGNLFQTETATATVFRRLLTASFRLTTVAAHVSATADPSRTPCRTEDFKKPRTLSPRRCKAAPVSSGHPVCATRQGTSPTPDTDRRRASIYRLEKRPCTGGAGRRPAPITLPEDVIPLSKEKHEHTKKCTVHLLYLQGLADAKAFEPSRLAGSSIEHCVPRESRDKGNGDRKSRPSSLVEVRRERRRPDNRENARELHKENGRQHNCKSQWQDPMRAPPTFFEDWREVFKDLPVVLTAKQLEPVLGLHCKTIWAMAQKGILPSYRFGSNVRFNKYEILRWLEAHRDGP